MSEVDTGMDKLETPDNCFENYELKPKDLEVLGRDIDQLAASQLVEDDVFKLKNYLLQVPAG